MEQVQAVATQGSRSAREFTEGPWKAGCSWMNEAVVASDGKSVAIVKTDRREWGANADLIAAAPELYRELEDTRSDLWCWLNGDKIRFEEVIDRIDALLHRLPGSAQ